MERLSNELRTLSQTEAAQAMGIKRVTLAMWKTEGWLTPTLDVQRDRSTFGAETRAYVFADILAGVFRRITREQFRFNTADLNEMTAMVQRADPKELKHAEIVTVRTSQMMMRHIWVSDMRRELNGEDLGEGTHADGYAWINTLGDRLRNRARLAEIVDALLAQFSKRIEQDFELAKLKLEA